MTPAERAAAIAALERVDTRLSVWLEPAASLGSHTTLPMGIEVARTIVSSEIARLRGEGGHG